MQYHILCSPPGMRRGGRENPAHASYDPGDHTPDQLRALLAEPAITIVIGERMTAEHVAALEAVAGAPAPAEGTAATGKPAKAKG